MPRKDRSVQTHWPHEFTANRGACGMKARIVTTDPDVVTCGSCQAAMKRSESRKAGKPVPIPKYRREE